MKQSTLFSFLNKSQQKQNPQPTITPQSQLQSQPSNQIKYEQQYNNPESANCSQPKSPKQLLKTDNPDSDDNVFVSRIKRKLKLDSDESEEDIPRQKIDISSFKKTYPIRKVDSLAIGSNIRQKKNYQNIMVKDSGLKNKSAKAATNPKLQSDDEAVQNNKTVQQNEGQPEFSECTPQWAEKLKHLDSQKRPVSHPDHDPTTLYIPPDEWKKLTPTMKQYWGIKAEDFDKIVLFKLGKFYELFYDDAEVSNKYLDLKWMGTKMHTGFPEKSLDRYVNRLIELGFKVVVVQQMQTPTEMEERIAQARRTTGKKAEKVVDRKVTHIHTKGTYVADDYAQHTEINGPNRSHFAPQYLLSVSVEGFLHGFSLFDATTNQIIVGCEPSQDQFKTVLYQTRPVEVIYNPATLPSQYTKMMTESFLGMIQSPLVNKNNIWSPQNTQVRLSNLYGGASAQRMLQKFTGTSLLLIQSTLAGLFAYLDKLKMQLIVDKSCSFHCYRHESMSRTMILDSQAIQHLQILQNSANHEEKGSLFYTINRCKTAFGKRMLRTWLLSPLRNLTSINERLDAIQDLAASPAARTKFEATLSRVPDLQRIVKKLYKYSINNLSNQAVYFDDIESKRMHEYLKLIDHFKICWSGIQGLQENLGTIRSARLRRLLTFCDSKSLDIQTEQIYLGEDIAEGNSEGLLPDIRSAWEQLDFLEKKDNAYVPKPGVSDSYDQTQKVIEDIKVELDQYLQQQKSLMKCKQLRFVHTKQRYEIEVPEDFDDRKPSTYVFSSKRQGYSRYTDRTSRKLVKDLQTHEQELKRQMRTFVSFFFQKFKEKALVWERFVKIVAELDCLQSGASLRLSWDSCRPKFGDSLEIVQGKYPSLQHSDFVGNSIKLSRDTNALLLTGPNMGGKSTLLRMTCQMAILAQMGLFVPCQSYIGLLFDRVFTRIGASDRLMEGKSTFYIEMEETKTVLDFATPHSLVIMDELGRGTSTFDGMSIAHATLYYLVHNIGCFTLFATHYHLLLEQFMFNSHVSINHMGYELDEASKRLIFYYKLMHGGCTQSFGFNVARVVGIPQNVCQEAEKMSEIMSIQIKGKREASVNRQFLDMINFLDIQI